MAYRFQFRGDTEENWKGVVLADREIGIIIVKDEKTDELKNTNLYKIGDGKNKFEDLPLFGFDGTLSNTLDVVDGEQPSNEAVSKEVLVAKFDSLDKALSDSSAEFDLFKKNEFNTLSDKVDQDNATILEHTKNIETINKTIDEQTTGINGLNEDLAAVKEDIKNKHQVLNQQQFDQVAKEDGAFYYIYEETE